MERNKFKNILLIEEDGLTSGSLSRFYSNLEIRTGLFNHYQRLKIQYPDSLFFYHNSDESGKKSFFERNPDLHCFTGEKYDLALRVPNFEYQSILNNVGKTIKEDFKIAKSRGTNNQYENVRLTGNESDLFIGAGCVITHPVIMNNTMGPIFIDTGVKIIPYSYLVGPLYIGRNSTIIDATILGNTIIGSNCVVSGKISNSIICDYSNKAHVGKLKGAFVGSWVNIGGLTSTFQHKTIVDITNVVLSDFVRLGGGALILNGTFCDIGTTLTDMKVEGYYPPFTLLTKNRKYPLRSFLIDLNLMMKRRERLLSISDIEIIKMIYDRFRTK